MRRSISTGAGRIDRVIYSERLRCLGVQLRLKPLTAKGILCQQQPSPNRARQQSMRSGAPTKKRQCVRSRAVTLCWRNGFRIASWSTPTQWRTLGTSAARQCMQHANAEKFLPYGLTASTGMRAKRSDSNAANWRVSTAHWAMSTRPASCCFSCVSTGHWAVESLPMPSPVATLTMFFASRATGPALECQMGLQGCRRSRNRAHLAPSREQASAAEPFPGNRTILGKEQGIPLRRSCRGVRGDLRRADAGRSFRRNHLASKRAIFGWRVVHRRKKYRRKAHCGLPAPEQTAPCIGESHRLLSQSPWAQQRSLLVRRLYGFHAC